MGKRTTWDKMEDAAHAAQAFSVLSSTLYDTKETWAMSHRAITVEGVLNIEYGLMQPILASQALGTREQRSRPMPRR